MELYELIPDKSDKWCVKKNQLLFNKLNNDLPLCFIDKNKIIYVYLENRLHKQVLKLTQHLVSLNVEFYFLPPIYSHPATIQSNEITIDHYLFSYSNKFFHKGFREINFDLIRNLVKFCDKENCYNLIKTSWDKFNEIIHKKYFDYYSNEYIYEYDEYIRDDFNSLYRHIQINKIL